MREGTKNAGESNGGAKLTEGQVREIFSRYNEEGISMAALGREYGVSNVTVFNIVNGHKWKSLNLDDLIFADEIAFRG